MSSGLHLGLVGAGRIGSMHAANAVAVPGVARLTVIDADAALARQVADAVGADAATTVEALLRSGIDGLLVVAPTAAHPALIRAGVDAGVPVFCEKPVASDVASSLPVLAHVADRGAVVQVGHQRRLDAGYLRAREAVSSGELGWLQGLRAVTCDATPPPVSFLATSGGLFRDVSVHDLDVLRWVTGREVTEVWARGSNNGDPAIGAVGDVDTALAVCTLDDGTLATVTASRYDGAGHDVRLEVQGSAGTLVVGLDERTALRSAEPGATSPSGPSHTTFAERFAQAYRDELVALTALVRGERGLPVGRLRRDALRRPADRGAGAAHHGPRLRGRDLGLDPARPRRPGRDRGAAELLRTAELSLRAAERLRCSHPGAVAALAERAGRVFELENLNHVDHPGVPFHPQHPDRVGRAPRRGRQGPGTGAGRHPAGVLRGCLVRRRRAARARHRNHGARGRHRVAGRLAQYDYIPYEARDAIRTQLRDLSRELDLEELRTQAIVSIDSTSRMREGREAEFWLDSCNAHVFDPESGENLTCNAKAAAS